MYLKKHNWTDEMSNYNDFYDNSSTQINNLSLINDEEWDNFQIVEDNFSLNLEGEQDEWLALSQALDLEDLSE